MMAPAVAPGLMDYARRAHCGGVSTVGNSPDESGARWPDIRLVGEVVESVGVFRGGNPAYQDAMAVAPSQLLYVIR